jgi:hypothetical protein
MSVHFFAVRIEPFLLVAAEIDDQAAATLLDSGQTVLLGTVAELHDLAARHRRALVTISRARTRSAAQSCAIPAPPLPAQPSPTVSTVRRRTDQREEIRPPVLLPVGAH